jgi:hypothetical protein
VVVDAGLDNEDRKHPKASFEGHSGTTDSEAEGEEEGEGDAGL